MVLPEGWVGVTHEEPHAVVELLSADAGDGGPESLVLVESGDLLVGLLCPGLVLSVVVVHRPGTRGEVGWHLNGNCLIRD